VDYNSVADNRGLSSLV